MEESEVTAITFYRFDMEEASAYIRKRFKAIVDANPWLAGRLVRNKQHKNVQLVHPQTPVSEDVIDQLFHSNLAQLQIGSEMKYEELCKAAKPAVLNKGRTMLNKPTLFTQITMVPDANHQDEGFALIFSLSHIVADGQTYHQVLNALSITGTIERASASTAQP
jgi:hypothetical protein